MVPLIKHQPQRERSRKAGVRHAVIEEDANGRPRIPPGIVSTGRNRRAQKHLTGPAPSSGGTGLSRLAPPARASPQSPGAPLPGVGEVVPGSELPLRRVTGCGHRHSPRPSARRDPPAQVPSGLPRTDRTLPSRPVPSRPVPVDRPCPPHAPAAAGGGSRTPVAAEAVTAPPRRRWRWAPAPAPPPAQDTPPRRGGGEALPPRMRTAPPPRAALRPLPALFEAVLRGRLLEAAAAAGGCVLAVGMYSPEHTSMGWGPTGSSRVAERLAVLVSGELVWICPWDQCLNKATLHQEASHNAARMGRASDESNRNGPARSRPCPGSARCAPEEAAGGRALAAAAGGGAGPC
ncbi:basic proline-rich protein-like [Caloenas nicobarica]|uniref:basic proline-rich protein-like n=1 Tax=Caloenas nicobarica TaxID=187106 RepID=UPI0032B85911